MSGDIHEVLRKHYDVLIASYTETLERVQELQRTLGLHILPGLVDELQLDQGSQTYCLEWMKDSGVYFVISPDSMFTELFVQQDPSFEL